MGWQIMTALILNAIPGEVWAALGAIVAAVVAWFGVRRSGAKAERAKVEGDNAAAYRKTMEAMQNAGNDDLDDDTVRKRLRDRAKR
jgi:hypothetical protein